MFTSDFAEAFSGLSSSQIKRLEDSGLLKPERSRGVKYYTYGDIYILRVIKILLREGLKNFTIESAFQYLRDLKPEDPLSSFVLLHDNKDVYTVIDGTQFLVQASTWGQMMLNDVPQVFAVGSELEQTRLKMNSYVASLKTAAQQAKTAKAKVYAVDDLDRLFA
jgi:DNA-binding transcriptional MerR regulator